MEWSDSYHNRDVTRFRLELARPHEIFEEITVSFQ